MWSRDFDKSILNAVAHRPWPLPDAPWVMRQSWHDLLFAHWTVDAADLRARVPGAFDLDLFDGAAWLGIVPFTMRHVALRALPALPWLSAFPELNVRTYVRVADRPGIYFFSLDAARWLAVQGARVWLNLPYEWASMSVRATGARVAYESRRRSDGRIRFEATYAPTSDGRTPRPGTLEHFLTERYCLYHITRRGTPYRLEIHHPPWLLHSAEAAIAQNTLTVPIGLTVDRAPVLLHFSRRQDMVAWTPVRLS
jgi:uncharacterized protein YqjF (DUF2071 family)